MQLINKVIRSGVGDESWTSDILDIGTSIDGSVSIVVADMANNYDVLSLNMTSDSPIVVAGGAGTLTALGLTAGTFNPTPATTDSGDGPYTVVFPELSFNSVDIDLTGVVDAATLNTAITAAAVSGVTNSVSGDHVRIQSLNPLAIAGTAPALTPLGLVATTTNPSATTNNGPWVLIPGAGALVLAGTDIDLTLVTDASSLKTAIDAESISGMTTTVQTAALKISRTSAFTISGTQASVIGLGATTDGAVDINSGPEPYSIVTPSLVIAGQSIDISALTDAASLKTAIDTAAISGLTTSVVSTHVHLSRTSNFVISGNSGGLTPTGFTAATYSITAVTVSSGNDPFTLPGSPTLTINTHSVDLTGVTTAHELELAIQASGATGLSYALIPHTITDDIDIDVAVEGSNQPPPSGVILNNGWVPDEDSWVVIAEDESITIEDNGTYYIPGPFGKTRWVRVVGTHNGGVGGTLVANATSKGNQ